MSKFFIPFISCLCLGASSISQTIETAGFKKDTTILICPGGHVAFPSVLRLPNDSLFVVYRKGAGHVEITGQIMKQSGSPDGTVWNTPQVLFNTLNVDDRDPSVALLDDGRIMLNFYTYKPGNSSASPPIPSITAIHVAFSSDYGNTFSTPACIDGNELLMVPPGSVFTGDGYNKPDGSRFQAFATSAPALNVNNLIVIPAYGGDPGLPSAVPSVYLSAPTRLYFFKSQDGGLTWDKEIIGENYLPESWLGEPDLAMRKDGSFVLHYRCADSPVNPMSPGPLRQAFMDSDLEVFIPDLNFPFVGHAPDIYRLTNGLFVSGFRHVNPGPASQDICFMFSIDEGQNWSDTLRIQQGTTESGYPSFAELANGKLLMSYYIAGGTSIKATIFNIDIKYKVEPNPQPIVSNDENSLEDIFTIFPNPNNGRFTLSLANMPMGVYQLRIISSNGEIISSQNVDNEEMEQFPVNLDNLSSGMYFVQVSDNTNFYTLKFMLSD